MHVVEAANRFHVLETYANALRQKIDKEIDNGFSDDTLVLEQLLTEIRKEQFALLPYMNI